MEGKKRIKDTINCYKRKQSLPCWDCADNTCVHNYYYDQPKYKRRKTIANYKDKVRS